MQQPKKIVRTTRIGQTITQQQTSHIISKTVRLSPQEKHARSEKGLDSKQKSQYSFQLSKSSEGSSLNRNSGNYKKRQSLQFILPQKYQAVQKQLYELKRMELSHDFRKNLIKLQKYDANFTRECQKLLKGPLQAELRRLEKIKKQQKQMIVKYYDTELLVTCLFYHQKVTADMSKVQAQLNQTKKVKIDLQKKLFEAQNQLKKQNSKTSLHSNASLKKSSGNSDKELPKELQSALNFSIRALNNKQYPQARKQMANFIQRAKKEQSFEQYVRLIQRTSNLTSDIEKLQQNLRNFQKQSLQTNKNIELSNKYVRQSKWADLEKLQIKLSETKKIKSDLNLSLLLQSVMENNKSKSKQLISKSKQKIHFADNKTQNNQVQNLKKEILALKDQIKNQKQKSDQMNLEKSKQNAELLRLRSLQKQYKSLQSNTQTRKIQQKNKQLQEQKKSLETRAKSLEHTKQTQQQKVTMLQKKNTSLQLSLKSKEHESSEMRVRMQQMEKQFKELNLKNQKLQKQQLSKDSRISGNSIVNIQELRSLQIDFNQLSRQKQEEEYNYAKIIQEKQQKIREYETRLEALDKFSPGQNQQILKLQLQQKDKELIKIKKRLIESLQSKNDTSKQVQSVKTADFTAIQNLTNEILQIRHLKKQQSLGQGFNIEFNNIQRQQWRDVSKKIKQYRKKYPKVKFITYLDEKHKYEFDLTQKLTDYEEKTLAIHNAIYRIKSVITGHENVQKPQKDRRNQSQNWCENVELIHIKEKTQFAKLFNGLIDELHKFFTNGKFSFKNVKETSVQLKKDSNQQKQNILQQITLIQSTMQKLISSLSIGQKIPVQMYNSPEYLSKLFTTMPQFAFYPQFEPTFRSLTKCISHFIVSRQAYHIQKLSQETNRTKKLNDTLSQRDKQIRQHQNWRIETEKQKKMSVTNFNKQTKQTINVQEMKQQIIELEKTISTYTYFKQVIEQQEIIIDYFIAQSGEGGEVINQDSKKNIDSTATSKKTNSSILTGKSFISNDNSSAKVSITDIISSFKKKYFSKTKLIDYIQKIRHQNKQQRKRSSQTKFYIQNLRATLEQLVELLNFQYQMNYREKVISFSKKSKKLEQLNQLTNKSFLSSGQYQGGRNATLNQEENSLTQVSGQKAITDKINTIYKACLDHFKRMSEISQKNTQMSHKFSTLELNNQQTLRQVDQLVEMQKIFQFIIDKKILNAKIGNLPYLTQNQATINKDPEIIRQIYLNEIKKNNKSSPYNMLKNSSMTPKSASVISFSDYSMKTSRIQEHHNLIIETTFRLFSKVNELHIQYEDSISQKFEQSLMAYTQNGQTLKQKVDQLTKALNDARDKIKSIQVSNKKSVTNEKSHNDLLMQLQTLRQRNTLVQNQNKKLQLNIKTLDVFKNQLEQQKALLDKIITIGSSNVKQSLPIKQSRNAELQEKKQINTFKKNYPKSRLIPYIELVGKKFSSLENKLSSLETEKQSVLTFYDQLIKKVQKDSDTWFKGYEPKIKGNGQLIGVIRKLVLQICDLKTQLQSIQNINLELQSCHQQLSGQSKQLKQLENSLQALKQVIQIVQKLIQQKLSSNSKQKDELFTNQFCLKNLFDQETRKKKSSNLQLVNTSLAKLLHQISLGSSIRDAKRSEEFVNLKNKLTKQKEDLNDRIIQVNLKNKQLQVLNKELSTENRLIKQSLKKLQGSINYLEDTRKSTQNNEKSKEYEILRLKETIQTYVNQQTKLQLSINRLQKDKKQQERLGQRWKKQIQKLKEQIHDLNEEKMNLNKIMDSLRQKHGEKQNSIEEGQALINNLRSNYARTQKQLQTIELKVSLLLGQKSVLQEQLNRCKSQVKKQKQVFQKQLAAKKVAIQTLQKSNLKYQKENQQLALKIKHLQNTKQLQISHQISIIHRLQAQIKEAGLRQKKEKDELMKRNQLLVLEKKSIIQREQKQVQKYRQKLLQMELHKQKSKNTQAQSFNKDIEQMNRNYTQLIKSYEKQKLESRQKFNKTTNQYEIILKKTSHQKIEAFNHYEKEIDEEKKARFSEVKKLKDDILILQHQNDRFKSTILLNEKELGRLNQEKHSSNIKLHQLQNSLREIGHKYQMTEQRLVQSQKVCTRLGSFQRKAKQYENILLLNNIGVSQQSSQKKPPNRMNSLEIRLKQLQAVKQKCSKLQSTVQKLSISLEKQLSQKQFVKQQAQLNRQDYIKLAAQSKEELRQLREQNKILYFEKNISQNQFSIYKENIRQLLQQNNVLEEETRNLKVRIQKQKITFKDSIQREFNLQIQYLQRELKQKTLKLSQCESEIVDFRQKIHENEHQNGIKHIQLIQLGSKLKQSQLRAKNQRQKSQILFSSEKNQLKTQNQHLRSSLTKAKFELEMVRKDTSLYKITLEEKTRQNSKLKLEFQSLQTLTKMQKNNLENKIRELQSHYDDLHTKAEETSRYQIHQKIFMQKKQTNQISSVRKQLSEKNSQMQIYTNRIYDLQKIVRDKTSQIQSLKQFASEMQQKIDSKMRELSDFTKKNLELDMKNKDLERNFKFENLQVKAELDLYRRLYSELQKGYEALEKQISEGRIPFSPSTTTTLYQTKENFSVSIQNLERDNFALKKESQSLKQKKQQLEFTLLSARQKNSELTLISEEYRNVQMEANNLKQKLIQAQNFIQISISRQRQLQISKSHFQAQLQSLHQQIYRLTQQSRSQQEKQRNSQRVLDHEIIEYKSKLQNTQDCLKQQKQKTYALKLQFQKIKRQMLDAGKYSDSQFKSKSILQSELQKLQNQIHEKQKKLISKGFHVQQLLQNDGRKSEQIKSLMSEVSKLQRQNQVLLLNQSSSVSFINSQNLKLNQLFQILEGQQYDRNVQQIQNRTEFDLLMCISSQIQNMVSQNNILQKKCLDYQKQIGFFTTGSKLQFNQEKASIFYLDSMVQNIQDFVLMENILENVDSIEKTYLKVQPSISAEYFQRVQEYLKNLVQQASNGSHDAQIIERYELSLENLKKLIKLYIQLGDIGAYQSLKQICTS